MNSNISLISFHSAIFLCLALCFVMFSICFSLAVFLFLSFFFSLPAKQLIIFHTRFFSFILFFSHFFSCGFFFILLSIYADTIHNVDRYASRGVRVGTKNNKFQYSLLITRLFNNNKTTATTTTKRNAPCCCCVLLFA